MDYGVHSTSCTLVSPHISLLEHLDQDVSTIRI